MKYKDIIFSTDMVRAIMREVNPKTMTRRPMKPQPPEFVDWLEERKDGFKAYMRPGESCDYPLTKPRYKHGDVLYVKETWGETKDGQYVYKSQCDTYTLSLIKTVAGGNVWRSPRYMPKAAARLFLRVTDVRAERLQDIKVNDVFAEGVDINEVFIDINAVSRDSGYSVEYERACDDAAIKAFSKLWDSIYAKKDGGIYTWERNPWVFCYTFKRINREGFGDAQYATY